MSKFYNTEKFTEIEADLEILTAQVWDHVIEMPEILEWLKQFDGQVLPEEEEKEYMLIALSKFMFFSQRMIREMLISLYRDNFKAPLIQQIRRENNNSLDFKFLDEQYSNELKLSRFIGVGNPAESGAHLLYIFRQVNDLRKVLFRDLYHSFEPKTNSNNTINWCAREPNIKRYVFFDDFVGGGTQITSYLKENLLNIKKNNPTIELSFLSIFSTTEGLITLNKPEIFDGKATCLFELDDTYKSCFADARYFNKLEKFDMDKFKKIVNHYGSYLYPNYPLGHSNCELMIGFSHNTPNNTLPIFWKNGYIESLQNDWFPIFKRFEKNYGSMRS
ncbi:phosphoribosyltransferase-like protein [Acinetobacter piscicola]|uniref:phosphoribosyltransferase-like protein n=1 Tax=Acinetobacter piscicola TaxID=2006115 RepID=UPI000B7C981C|nr:hypothetical protein [Acinetobacter piscicola]